MVRVLSTPEFDAWEKILSKHYKKEIDPLLNNLKNRPILENLWAILSSGKRNSTNIEYISLSMKSMILHY